MYSCDDLFRKTVKENLAKFNVNREAGAKVKAAAVAVVICDQGYGADIVGMPRHETWQNDAAMILTKRSSKLRRHAGQWALPGGRVDDGETVEQAAMRELEEEIGLNLGKHEIIGRLDDFVTRSGFVMSPIIFWAGSQIKFQANFDEVDSIHRIPIKEFMRDDAPMLSDSDHSDAPVLRMPVGETWIAAPTAAILLQFREVCVLGKNTRVAHFDQPEFAWR